MQFLPYLDSESCSSYCCYICSIRRRALDLLYGMCDVTNAKDIVEELLQVQLNLVIFKELFLNKCLHIATN